MKLKIIGGALLLQFVFSSCTAQSIVTITTPPEDATVCRGSDVTISCGYDSDIPFDPVWRINRTAHILQSQIMNMSSYQLNNPTTPVNYSLTIFSINGTTTIRCTITSQSLKITAALSPDITITVIGSHNDRSDAKESDISGLDSLSTGVAIIITNTATFILTLTATAIITLIIAYFCVKRRFVNANLQYQSPQEKVLCEQVNSPSHTSSKDDLESQSDPAYGTSHEVIKVTNAVYENCK